MNAQTTVPDVVDALIALFGTAVAPVVVVDGMVPLRNEDQFVSVETVNQTATYAEIGGGGRSSQSESYEVHGRVRVYSGSGNDQSYCRQTAYALLAQMNAAIRADVRLGLGQTVLNATLTAADLSEQGPLDNGGRYALIDYVVTVNARPGRMA